MRKMPLGMGTSEGIVDPEQEFFLNGCSTKYLLNYADVIVREKPNE
jgi:hypothetical protein